MNPDVRSYIRVGQGADGRAMVRAPLRSCPGRAAFVCPNVRASAPLRQLSGHAQYMLTLERQAQRDHRRVGTPPQSENHAEHPRCMGHREFLGTAVLAELARSFDARRIISGSIHSVQAGNRPTKLLHILCRMLTSYPVFTCYLCVRRVVISALQRHSRRTRCQ